MDVCSRYRLNHAHLDRPAHLALTGIYPQSGGAGAVEIALVWYACLGDLNLPGEADRERAAALLVGFGPGRGRPATAEPG
jgi:hypothetical protein